MRLLQKEHHMTTPEQLLVARRRRRILDEETVKPFGLDAPDVENTSVKQFINFLARVMRNIGGKLE
jgi:hypothetical protein